MGVENIFLAVAGFATFMLVTYGLFELSRRAIMAVWGFGVRHMKSKRSSAIQTIGGAMFDVMDPDPDSVFIDDIAHALSMQCRYNGHVKRFYSVAEHSCHLCDYVLDMSDGMEIEKALHALMHDAAEAYLGDMPTPIKQVMPKFTDIEYEVELAIEYALDCQVSKVGHPWLDDIDKSILTDEMSALVHTVRVHFQPLGANIQNWPPEKAKAEFLTRYSDLRKIMDEDGDYTQESGHSYDY